MSRARRAVVLLFTLTACDLIDKPAATPTPPPAPAPPPISEDAGTTDASLPALPPNKGAHPAVQPQPGDVQL